MRSPIIPRRTFLKTILIGASAASLGSVPRRKETVEGRAIRREKESRRKAMEPELVENIKERMILILNDKKASEKLNKELLVLVEAKEKNFEKAKSSHRKKLLAAIRKGPLENSLQEVSKLKCGVILMRYMVEGEENSARKRKAVSGRLKNINQFLTSLINPAYDLLHTKIERSAK